MSRVIARLLMSLVCAPIVLVLCIAMVIAIEELNLLDEEIGVMIAASAAPVLLTASWLVVWRRVIRWTPARRTRTVVLLGANIAGAAAIFGIATLAFGPSGDAAGWSAIGNLLLGMGSLVACLWVWKENAKERFERIRAAGVGGTSCPLCRYDLSGLTNLTCPECGTSFRLGQVVEEHRRREAPEDFQ